MNYYGHQSGISMQRAKVKAMKQAYQASGNNPLLKRSKADSSRGSHISLGQTTYSQNIYKGSIAFPIRNLDYAQKEKGSSTRESQETNTNVRNSREYHNSRDQGEGQSRTPFKKGLLTKGKSEVGPFNY